MCRGCARRSTSPRSTIVSLRQPTWPRPGTASLQCLSIHLSVTFQQWIIQLDRPPANDDVKLTTLNNKILCILQRKSPRCCTTYFYTQYNLPPAQLFAYHVINLVYKMLYSPFLLPSMFQQYFVLISNIHLYSTRYNKLSIPWPVSHFGHRSLRFKGPQLWNRLPSELTDITSYVFCCSDRLGYSSTELFLLLWQVGVQYKEAAEGRRVVQGPR